MLWTKIIPEKYEQVTYILPLVLGGQIVAAMTPLLTNYLIYFEKTFIVSVTGLVMSLATLALSILVIPKWGVYGAALVFLSASLMYFILYAIIIEYLKKKYIAAKVVAEEATV
jgi:O-antigen/teichoic acid export membrane protein